MRSLFSSRFQAYFVTLKGSENSFFQNDKEPHRPKMKFVRLSLFTAVFSTLFFTQCGKLNEIRVVGRNFDDEINLAQNLVFTFNKDIVSESDLNSWESTKFVEFIPAVAGKFKWTAPNELIFSPASGFDPATEYRAELSKELAKKPSKNATTYRVKKSNFIHLICNSPRPKPTGPNRAKRVRHWPKPNCISTTPSMGARWAES